MREIKFRAWHKHHKVMFAVMEITFDAQYNSGFSRIVAYPYDNWNPSENEQGEWANRAPRERSHYLHHEIDNLELMQYTGLKDKNGKEVYEGDIVQSDRGLFEVYWRDDFAGFYLRKADWIDLISMTGNVTWCEIIGNIYENPELLQQAEN